MKVHTFPKDTQLMAENERQATTPVAKEIKKYDNSTEKIEKPEETVKEKAKAKKKKA